MKRCLYRLRPSRATALRLAALARSFLLCLLHCNSPLLSFLLIYFSSPPTLRGFPPTPPTSFDFSQSIHLERLRMAPHPLQRHIQCIRIEFEEWKENGHFVQTEADWKYTKAPSVAGPHFRLLFFFLTESDDAALVRTSKLTKSISPAPRVCVCVCSCVSGLKTVEPETAKSITSPLRKRTPFLRNVKQTLGRKVKNVKENNLRNLIFFF